MRTYPLNEKPLTKVDEFVYQGNKFKIMEVFRMKSPTELARNHLLESCSTGAGPEQA